MQNKRGKIIQLLNKSKQELYLYQKNHRFVNLSQACEKTWVAFLLALEYKSGREIKNGFDRERIGYGLGLGELYQKARNLHYIHYEGSPAAYDEETFRNITTSHSQIRKMLL